jgi:large subunit ribosomal protein L23
MTNITEKSSVEKTLRARNAKAAEKLGAKEEKVTYVVKRKGKADETKEKTIYTYTKPVRQKFGFIVRPEANKIEIAKEVEATYNVTVEDVNTIRYAGKRSSRYTKAGLVRGHKNAYKKAIVTLKEGDTIDFYSNIQ